MNKRIGTLLLVVSLVVALALSVVVTAAPDVLWDQPKAGPSTIRVINSNYFASTGGGLYAADDFSNADAWCIESIFIEGQVNTQGVVANANSLNWVIYANAGGVPAGDPSTGGELWSHSCSPSAPEVTINYPGGDWRYPEVTLDIMQAQGTPLYLPSGHYWLVFYPVLPSAGQLYARYSADTTNLDLAQVMSPTGLYGWPTSWTAWTTFRPGNSAHDLSFRLEGFAPPPPVAAFNATPTSGYAPLRVNFTDLSTGNITSWNWTFGDGGTSTDRSPSHIYVSPGIYTVGLTVADDWSSNSTTKPDFITVSEPRPVGGEAYPVNKTSLLLPWIAVGIVLAGGLIWYVLRRRRVQS